MDPNQIGFVEGMTTHVNILQLTQQMKLHKKTDPHYAVFIDFKSAYNTLIRQKIYQLLGDKNILLRDEVQFLKNLHNRVHFIDEYDEKYFFKNGVHQGSPISPALFNIYLEEFLIQLKEAFKPILYRTLWYKAYADDLVFIVRAIHLT